MADQWYVREGRLIEGPLPWEHVRQAALSGEIDPETLISRMATGGWVAARRYAMLKFSDSPKTMRGAELSGNDGAASLGSQPSQPY